VVSVVVASDVVVVVAVVSVCVVVVADVVDVVSSVSVYVVGCVVSDVVCGVWVCCIMSNPPPTATMTIAAIAKSSFD